MDGGWLSVPAQILDAGAPDKLLLRGQVVTPTVTFAGEVLVEGNLITCVAASCASMAGAATATVIDTHGIIFPGLIDTHHHVQFDIFDETDWSPTMSYLNHNQWPNEARYMAMVDAKQYLNAETPSPVDVGCELDKYGELKGLIAGTTSMVGAASPANRACYGSLARTIDQTPNGLGFDRVQTATLFPTTASADSVCGNFTAGTTTAYLVHVAEGLDTTALNEFSTLYTVSTVDGCLFKPQTAIVHGIALADAGFATMADAGMSLVWSPKSDVFLYGAGATLSNTTRIPLALGAGVNVALAPNWSIGGSQNLLDELRYADQVDNQVFGNVLDARALTLMVTLNAARVLKLDGVLGSLAAGKRADLMVVGGNPAAPYDALLAARPADVRLVLVDGVPLYGDAQLKPLGPATPGCESLDVCTVAKFICAARAGGTTADKLGQTYQQFSTALQSELTAYDALNLTPWKFAPIAPLVKCQ